MTHRLGNPRRLIATTAILWCAVGAGCGDDVTASQPVPFNATTVELAEAGAAVDDAHARLADALSDQAFAATLRPPLGDLSTHIAANRADRAAPALNAALQALNGSAGTAPAADGPDRAAIGLALTHIASLLAR